MITYSKKSLPCHPKSLDSVQFLVVILLLRFFSCTRHHLFFIFFFFFFSCFSIYLMLFFIRVARFSIGIILFFFLAFPCFCHGFCFPFAHLLFSSYFILVKRVNSTSTSTHLGMAVFGSLYSVCVTYTLCAH